MQQLGTVPLPGLKEAAMARVSGIVQDVRPSPGRGKAQGRLAWSIIVAGESYSAGFQQPSVKVGDLVEFRCEVRDGRWKNAYDLRRIDGGQAASPGSGTPASAPAPRAPAAAGAPAVVGAGDLRLVAAAVIVAAWASTARPLDWTLEQFVSKVAALAEKLSR